MNNKLSDKLFLYLMMIVLAVYLSVVVMPGKIIPEAAPIAINTKIIIFNEDLKYPYELHGYEFIRYNIKDSIPPKPGITNILVTAGFLGDKLNSQKIVELVDSNYSVLVQGNIDVTSVYSLLGIPMKAKITEVPYSSPKLSHGGVLVFKNNIDNEYYSNELNFENTEDSDSYYRTLYNAFNIDKKRMTSL